MYLGLTILCALAFLGIKTKEYNDKFTHYAIRFKDDAAAATFLKEAFGSDEVAVKEGIFANTYGMLDAKQAAEAKPTQLPDARNLQITGHIEGNPRFWSLTKLNDKKVETIQFIPDPPQHAKGEKAEAHEHKPHTVKLGELSYLSAYVPSHNTYFAIYFTLTGLHAAHVFAGAVVMTYLFLFGGRMWKTQPDRLTNRTEVAGLFWHFVDLVWIFLFPVLYLL
jgi:hypothetical protein